MSYRIIVAFLLLQISVNAHSQNKIIKVAINDLFISKDSLGFCLEFTNVSNRTVAIYKPETEDICRNILKIKFIGVDRRELHELFPCGYILDLDRLVLNCFNSICLKPREKFVTSFRFSVNKISPFLERKKSYKLFVELNLKDVNFETDLKCFFKENIQSGDIEIRH